MRKKKKKKKKEKRKENQATLFSQLIQKIPLPRSRILNAVPTYPFVSTRSLE